MNFLIASPILVTLISAIISLAMPKRLGKIMGVLGSTALLAVSAVLLNVVVQNGIQVAQIGNWPAPFGITFVVDIFSAIMVLLTGVTGFAVSIFAWHSVDAERHKFGFYPLFLIMLMGVSGAFLTGDIFNMYVWFEVLLISSFVLMVLGGERPQIEGAVKYVTLNLLSSTFFLVAVAILYGKLGTLNFADLAVRVSQTHDDTLVQVASLLLLGAFGIKAAVFPLYFWLPASYHTPPVAVSAVFAGLLTKVGVYALIRTFTLIFIWERAITHNILLVIAACTMFFGVIGAAVQFDFRRILSIHIISQIGYMIMGLALFSRLAIAGAVFYLIHIIVVKTNLFFISGLVNHIKGTYALKKLGGLYRAEPFLAFLFIISAFSLAGIPPLSGFWAKFLLIKAGLELDGWIIVAVALVVSVLTLFSMTKIWAEVFWKPDPNENPAPVKKDAAYFSMLVPILFMTVLILGISLYTEPFLQLAHRASDQLLNPSIYINAVLGAQQ
jgi:multicomponent Na+:H+ antiporter subunit D